MKAILVIYAPALEDNVMSAFKRSGLKKYSKIPYLHGVGSHSEPHLDTQIWPGSNAALIAITNDTLAKAKFLKDILEIKKEFIDEGIKAFVWEVEEEI